MEDGIDKGLSIRRTRLANAVSLVLVAILLVSCASQIASTNPAAAPTITFTRVPVAGEDNPEKLSAIEGRVTGAKPGQQIVLYARGKTTWWVQPFADNPLTKVDRSTWRNSTHPGAEYAALLVGPDFHPPLTTDVLPSAGVFASAVAQGELPIWHRWWFPFLCVIAGAAIIFGFHRLRLHQLSQKLHLRFEERLAERVRVAQELHDTLLQGVLSVSMQLHVVVEQLPPGSPALPAMNRILQLMEQVVEEGRNTLRGLRSSIESAHDLKTSLSRIPEELGNQKGVDFRVIVEGVTLPLRTDIRDEVYRISREALVNAFAHSHAQHIDLHLEYSASQLRILIRDDGRGIDPKVLQFGRDGHWGLSGMRERSERIGGKLRVLSRTGDGTEVELRVPSNIAFHSPPSSRVPKWLGGLRLQKESEPAAKERTG